MATPTHEPSSLVTPVCIGAVIVPAPSPGSNAPSITGVPFGATLDGREAMLFSLVNAGGMRVDITNYGALIVRLFCRDSSGRLDDVVLGYDSLEAYLGDSQYFGALVGRCGNRIARGTFKLDGATFRLATNNRPNGIPCALHGGSVGFNKVLWDATPLLVGDAAGLRLHYVSADGEEGYPGRLEVTVHYWLTPGDELKVVYEAVTDKATPVNLTQHSYFNLKGGGRGDILGHRVTINASRYTPVDAGLIPTGELASVVGTPFDFRTEHAVGERIGAPDPQLAIGNGYDHNWVLDRGGSGPALAATVCETTTGRILEVWTDEPGVQFYSGNFLDGTTVGKGGNPYPFRGGLCLETQHFPDSPNHPAFPGTILRPGGKYETSTVFRFSAR